MKRTLSYILLFAFICSAFVIADHEDRINENSHVSAEAADAHAGQEVRQTAEGYR